MRLRSLRNLPASTQRNSRRPRRQRTARQEANPIPENIVAVANNVPPHVNNSEDVNIKEIYNNVKSIPSYSSKIIDFLRQNETSSLHKRIRRKFKTRKTITYFPFDICMIDLAFYIAPDYVKANNGYKYIMVFVDVFSKMCYVEILKDKNGTTSMMALERIIKRLPETPNQIITDVGTEFYNSHVQQLFKEYGIVHYSLTSKHKASVAERMIQTLKGRLEKYFWKNKTKRYIDILDQTVNNYNNSPHRSIGMAPSAVNSKNIRQVFLKMYKNANMKTMPRLQVGDTVRIAKLKTIFEKGYTRRWSIELYTILTAKALGGVDYYKVKDETGNILPRQRYYYELNLVR